MSEIDSKLIKRINELAAKAKTTDLTAAEELERKTLREQYVKEFRAGFKTQIESLRVFDHDGKEVTPKKVREVQKKKNLRDD